MTYLVVIRLRDCLIGIDEPPQAVEGDVVKGEDLKLT
jgi:hypothetical protein